MIKKSRVWCHSVLIKPVFDSASTSCYATFHITSIKICNLLLEVPNEGNKKSEKEKKANHQTGSEPMTSGSQGVSSTAVLQLVPLESSRLITGLK